MRYADPHACPDCRGRIAGETACPHCGFDLTSPQAAELWRVFGVADRLVAEGRQRATAPAEPSSSITATAPHAPAAPVARPTRSWSTGSLLLALGAACLVVAGIIFVTVAWGSLGILGRALILLAVTAVIGAIAAWATRRRYPGTAESLWAVFLAFLSIDWLAAHAEGLFGDLAFGPSTLAWGAVIVAAGVAIVRYGRRTSGLDLVVPELAVGLTAWVAPATFTVWWADRVDGDQPFWILLVGAVLVLAVVAVARVARLRTATWVALVPLVGFAVALVVAAIVQSRDGEARPLVDVLPMLTLVAGVIAGGVLTPSLRIPLAAAATSGLLWLVWDFADDRVADSTTDVAPYLGLYVLVAILAMLAWALRRSDAWSTGARWAVAVWTAVCLAVVALRGIDEVLERWSSAWDTTGDVDFWSRPGFDSWSGSAAYMSSIEFSPAPDPWWLVLPVVAAAIAVLWASRDWSAPRLPDAARPEIVPITVVVAAAGVLAAGAMSTMPYVVFAWILIVAAVALALLLSPREWPWAIVPPVLAAAAMVSVPSASGVVAATWAVAAVGFAVVSWLDVHATSPRRVVSVVAAGLGTAAGLGAVDRVLTLNDPEPGWHGAILAGVSVGVLLLAMALDELPLHRAAVEAAAALGFVLALGVEASDGGATALILTIGAVGTALVGLLDDDRRPFRWVALGLVGAAWIVRLAASGVDTVEAYTAPFAVALLAAGVWRLRSDPQSRTWSVLAPGLTLALLPSLPQALAEPTGLRALLLGLVALGFLAAGVVLRWGAPVAGGAAVVAVLLLANVGPVAAAVPRWVLIALAGLVLLGVGTTWEKRVAEGRAVVTRLLALR